MTNKVILSVLFCLPLAINGASIVMAPQRCPLQNGNLLDVDLFVPSEADCVDKCSTHDKCFFYFFYKGEVFKIKHFFGTTFIQILSFYKLLIKIFNMIFFINQDSKYNLMRVLSRIS